MMRRRRKIQSALHISCRTLHRERKHGRNAHRPRIVPADPLRSPALKRFEILGLGLNASSLFDYTFPGIAVKDLAKEKRNANMLVWRFELAEYRVSMQTARNMRSK